MTPLPGTWVTWRISYFLGYLADPYDSADRLDSDRCGAMTTSRSDELIRRALESDFLSKLPTEAQQQLLQDAVILDLPAASVLYRDGDPPRAGVIVAGLVRMYLTSRSGRQVTVRYARLGDFAGAPLIVSGPVSVSAQAITQSTLLTVSTDKMRSLAIADTQVSWLLAQEVTHLLKQVLDAFAGNAFGSVRQRVARHLLDLAAERQKGAALIAPVTQQALADAVGTAREVVARTLRELRVAGVVESTNSGIALLDPDRLHDVITTDKL